MLTQVASHVLQSFMKSDVFFLFLLILVFLKIHFTSTAKIKIYNMQYINQKYSLSMRFDDSLCNLTKYCFIVLLGVRSSDDHYEPSLCRAVQYHASGRQTLGWHCQRRGHTENYWQSTFRYDIYLDLVLLYRFQNAKYCYCCFSLMIRTVNMYIFIVQPRFRLKEISFLAPSPFWKISPWTCC